jgi:hypothetical protein
MSVKSQLGGTLPRPIKVLGMNGRQSRLGMQVLRGRMWTAHNAYLQNDWELVYVEKRMY